MKQFTKIILRLSLLSLVACAQQKENKSGVAVNIEVEQLKGLTNEYILLDVRTPKEFTDGAIESATNINVKDAKFKSEIEKLDKTKHYLVYCRSGVRSLKAQGIMQEAGFENVTNLVGGYKAWNSK